MPQPTPAFANNLDETLAEAFRLLARGVADRRSPWRTPALATTGADGAPRVRTVILRAFDPAARTLDIHSDARAAKIAELATNPRAALHVWDSGPSIQARLACEATLHATDAQADAAWVATHPASRAVYGIVPTPGTPLAAPAEATFDAATERQNFRLIRLRLLTLEWLWLGPDGHRRARFTWHPSPHADWLVP